MPAWLHSRAEHIMGKNPSMSKGEAFAIATMQAHALGKTPASYGTAEGREAAEKKYKTPEDDVKAADPKAKTAFAEHVLPGTERYHSDRMLSILRGMAPRVWTPEDVELEKDAGAMDPLFAGFLDELEQMKSAGILGEAVDKVKKVLTTPIPGTPELPHVADVAEKLKGLAAGGPKARPSASFKAFQQARSAGM